MRQAAHRMIEQARAVASAILFVVPLTSDVGWQVLSYRGIPPHHAQFGPTGLTVKVARSAGPIVYPLSKPMRVHALSARGSVRGGLNVVSERQGQTGFDNYTLRLGLVEVGTRRPGFLERRFAPAWMKTLFDLAPPGAGISRLRFFNLGVGLDQVGQRRQHPLSDVIHEEIVAVPGADGLFDFSVELEGEVETAAIWIGADGDDTKSTFTLVLEHLELKGP